MKFLSMLKQNVDVQVTKYCGDNCCSWAENETDTVFQGEVYEPEFEYGAYVRTVEDWFYQSVQNGHFVAFDQEAVQWVAEKTKEA